MRALLGKLVVCLLLVVGTVGAWGEDKAASSADLEKLQDQVRALDKDVSVLKEVSSAKLEAQDKRLADLGWVTAQQANYISWTSIGITVLAFVAGFFSYITATRRAKEEARKAAREWFDEEANKLREQIKALEQEVAHGRQTVQTHVQSVADVGKQAQEDIEQLRQATESVLRSSTPNRPPPDAESVEVVQKASTALEKKPEAEFTAEDHYTRGVASYSANEYASALRSFEKAAHFPDLPPEHLAKYLFGKAVCLGELGRSDEAIACYDQVIERFGSDSSAALREQIAWALFSKGLALGALNRSDEEIACYNQLVERFGSDPTPALREKVAKAMNGLGFRSLRQVKQTWDHMDNRNERLTRAIQVLQEALERCSVEDKAITLGNLGYALFLLGQQPEAREITLECLRLGQDQALAVQRSDAQLHRIEPQDTAYEAMLTELWAEVQGQSSTNG